MKLVSCLSLVVCFVLTGVAHADTFGSEANVFEIEFVPIGVPGNAPDTTTISRRPSQAGSVAYGYRIGKFEVSEEMIDKANPLGDLGITLDHRGPNKPATSVSWFEAAQFVNWLNTSKGHSPAYKFVEVQLSRGGPPKMEFALWEPGEPGYNPNNLFRNNLAKYALPNVDEWYKAAYYDPETDSWLYYPTLDVNGPSPVFSGIAPNTAVFASGSPRPTGPADIMQAGGLSPFGTMAQGGNVIEWEETEIDLVNDSPLARRGARGGSWNSDDSSLTTMSRIDPLPALGSSGVGFRVVSIPEPSAAMLICLVVFRHLKRRNRSSFLM